MEEIRVINYGAAYIKYYIAINRPSKPANILLFCLFSQIISFQYRFKKNNNVPFFFGIEVQTTVSCDSLPKKKKEGKKGSNKLNNPMQLAELDANLLQ